MHRLEDLDSRHEQGNWLVNLVELDAHLQLEPLLQRLVRIGELPDTKRG